MGFLMESKTKVNVTNEDILRLCNNYSNAKVKSYDEIVAGFFGTIFKVTLEDDVIVIKIAPPDDVELLTYEYNIMEREIKVYQLLYENDIPVPKILFTDSSKKLIPYEYYIMSYIDGDNLFHVEKEIKDITSIRFQIMEILAKIHKIPMDHFGYDNLHEYPNTMSATYQLMLANAVQDGLQKKAEFPDAFHQVTLLLPQLLPNLNDCTSPKLLHFDLWSGNVMVKEGNVVAILDTERSFNGDPVAEFSTMLIDPVDPNNKQFIEHYNKYAESKIEYTTSTKVRYQLYKFYLFTLMYVEYYYRSINGSFKDQQDWCKAEFINILNTLKETLQ